MRRTLLGAVLLAAAAMTACDAGGGTAKAPEGGGGGAAPTATTPAPVTTTPAADPTAPPTTPPTTTAPPRRRPATPTPPASFDPARDITDLVISTPGLVLQKPVDGVRHGRLVVTVKNNGPKPVWGLRFGVELPESFSTDGGDWAGCTRLKSTKAGYPAGSICDKGYIAPGKSRTFRLGVESPAAKDGADSTVSRWLVDVCSAGPKDAVYRDRAPEDNRYIFSITRR